jgi:hypothetical protein
MIRKLVPTALAIALAAAIVPAAPAAAIGLAAPDKPKTKLTIGVIAEVGWATAVLLRCSPPGGGHPQPAEACAALKSAGGNPARLKPAGVACTLQYAPVTASITGVWKGKKVRWSRTFGNTCELTRATGVVFRF